MPPGVGTAISVGASLLGAAGSFFGGKKVASDDRASAAFQAETLRRNAIVRRDTAEEIRRATALEVQKGNERARSLLAAQESYYANSGVELEGSPLLVMEESQFQAQRDIAIKKYTGEWKASLAEFGADTNMFQASSVLSAGESKASGNEMAGIFGAAKSLLGGAYTVGKSFNLWS